MARKLIVRRIIIGFRCRSPTVKINISHKYNTEARTFRHKTLPGFGKKSSEKYCVLESKHPHGCFSTTNIDVFLSNFVFTFVGLVLKGFLGATHTQPRVYIKD